MSKRESSIQRLLPHKRRKKCEHRTQVAHTRFAVKLFKAIASPELNQNIVISPASIEIALAMVYTGAANETQRAISHVLELDGMTSESVNETYSELVEQLEQQIALDIKNLLEFGSNLPIRDTYLQTIARFYKADITKIGESQTIKLTNKTRFKGKWTAPFDPARTDEHPFQLSNGARKPCLMMSSPMQHCAYSQHENFEVVRLDYGKGRTGMYIILPAENISLSRVLENLLEPEIFESSLAQLVLTQGPVALPRFDADYSVELNQVLQGLGMEIAFDPRRADFSALSPRPAFIEKASHEAQIQVDEEGTEASASTIFTMYVGSSQPPAVTFDMVADRPFFYAIRDDLTGIFLFLGQVTDPVPNETMTWEQREQNMLPDMLDLMATNMADGLSFEAALGRAYEVWNHPIAVACGRALQEILLGKSRSDALKDMSVRLAIPDLTSLIEAINVAEQSDASLQAVVRDHAERLRNR